MDIDPSECRGGSDSDKSGESKGNSSSSNGSLPDIVAPVATSSPQKGKSRFAFGKFGSYSPVKDPSNTPAEGIVLLLDLHVFNLWN